MPEVQTVTGRVPSDALGFVLPHEHTGIALWHVPDRWDYWELTVDDAVVLPELQAFRAAGGGTLVDLTLPGVGRDPERLRRYAEATGLNVVMGCGWYRTAYYPAEARIDRRSADDLADELVREFMDGRRRDRDPARDHRRDRDRQAVAERPGGAGPPGLRPGRPADRHGDHDPRGAVAGRARPAPRVRGGGRRPGPGRHRARRLVPRPRPLPRDRPARREPRVRLPRDELHGHGAARRGAHDRPARRARRPRPRRADPAQPGRLPQRPAQGRTAATATSTSTSGSCPGSARPGSTRRRSGR